MTNAVLTVHNSRESFPMRNQALLAPLFAVFPTVVFCSRAAASSYPRWMRGMIRRTEIVPNGVDTARIDRVVEAESSARPSGFRVTTVGRLIPRKDPITVFEAFRAATDGSDELSYVGDGTQRTEVVARADRHGLGDRVEVTGLVERDEVYRLLARSSVVVSAARSEGLPVAVLEALASGVPVVLSDIPPHREIADGVDFVPLVPPGDTRGFAAAIREAKRMTPAGRAEVGARGRALVERRFGLRVMHDSYERVYRSVLARQRGAVSGRDGEVAA
jgi:glycosyltransferase involved in cell wall biosynthesis